MIALLAILALVAAVWTVVLFRRGGLVTACLLVFGHRYLFWTVLLPPVGGPNPIVNRSRALGRIDYLLRDRPLDGRNRETPL